MKRSRRKTWTVPHPQSDPSPQYPPQPGRHDDDSEAKDSYVKVCVFNNFLFSKGLSDTRATELFQVTCSLKSTGWLYIRSNLVPGMMAPWLAISFSWTLATLAAFQEFMHFCDLLPVNVSCGVHYPKYHTRFYAESFFLLRVRRRKFRLIFDCRRVGVNCLVGFFCSVVEFVTLINRVSLAHAVVIV